MDHFGQGETVHNSRLDLLMYLGICLCLFYFIFNVSLDSPNKKRKCLKSVHKNVTKLIDLLLQLWIILAGYWRMDA